MPFTTHFTSAARRGVRSLAFLAGALALAAAPVVRAQSTDSNAEAPKAELKLHWIDAGTTEKVAGVAEMKVPAGYVMLDPADTRKLMEAMHNPTGSEEEYFIAPTSKKWFAVLTYDGSTGYVKDTESIDAKAVLDSVKQGTEAANDERRKRGWSVLEITGWRFEPRYDAASRRLEWAIDATSEGHPVVNYNTRILGRQGVTSATVVAEPQVLDASVQEFKQVMGNFAYVDGQRYEQFKQGDKIAEYGLAALITGGAAAVVAKTGLWKVIVGFVAAFWKVIVGAVVVLFASLKRIFQRKAP